jgi:hypothetical protein
MQLTNQVIVQRLQLGSRRADPIGERRALDLDALTRQDLSLRYAACLLTTTWATSALVGSPPTISCAGAGAWTTPATLSAPS